MSSSAGSQGCAAGAASAVALRRQAAACRGRGEGPWTWDDVTTSQLILADSTLPLWTGAGDV